ncbi:heterokaryon incompatibility protein-domain-containing protein [Colletotrichum navitas]|uniref:Heterokaryon incompatibility protein-domain-containing protein n=1 Tax=Colletotrichum navitas TaxID=681940 RepID=A0AAD8V5X0_9PEZI|nr:heterokaryon incompatibility protein-domain-containing protein [Colletotrichum navitas]KAK1593823.1 heterokaryon incompatibility protein-domain-containing protein [Colletotrichum navitas]
MDDCCDEQFHVAWILPSPYHHKIATSVFDETYYHAVRSASSNAVYTTGRVGLHRVVVASRSPVAASPNTEDFINDLLHDFPAVRAGFLVSTDAKASQSGRARVGDIVFGTTPDLQSGTIYFDARQTKEHGRLFISGQAKHIPESVTSALEDFLGQKQHGEWLQHLSEGYPLHHRTFRGAIASSIEHFDDPLVLDHIGSKHDILCFETAAASMSSHSFILAAGIAGCSDNQQDCLRSAQVCEAVVYYLSGLVRLINPVKLHKEPPLTNYFQYESFDLDRPGFRLVRLEAGSSHDPIRCHLFQAYLDDKETIIPYEALSYCWGSSTSLRHTILVNGRFLFITENLFDALKNLRQQVEDRILWVDALCIDQSNVRERGHQVTWMGKVYEHAERVLFWLGHVPYNFRDLILSLVTFKREAPRDAWVSWTLDDPRWSDTWAQLQTQHLSRFDEVNLLSDLKSLMRNEWFSRVWVLQEVANAQKALLGCSEGWVDAMAFAMAPRLFGMQADTQCQAVIDIMPGPSRRTSWWAQKSNICTLLWRFRESQASDPRDRLFALLGLASDMKTGDERIVADYTQTEDAVLRNITTYLFNDKIHDFKVESLPDLQMNIPNFAAITLERMVFSGSNVEDLHCYMEKQNHTVWLSEVLVNYSWFRRSDHFDNFRNSSAFDQVILGQIPSTGPPKDSTTLYQFLKRHNGRINSTKETIEALNQSGIDMVVQVLRNNRQDVEITETFAVEATRKGPSILQAFLDRYDSKVWITEAFVIAALQNGPDTAQVLLSQRGGEIEITEAIVDAAVQSGHTTFQHLLEAVIFRTSTIIDALPYPTDLDTLRLILEIDINSSLLEITRQKGIDLVRMALEQNDNSAKITDALTKEVARIGPDTLRG